MLKAIVRNCLVLASLISLESSAVVFKPFDFQTQSPASCKVEDPNCVTTHQLVDHALRHSYDSREKIELLFQARTRSKEILGRVLPHLNAASAFSMANQGYMDFVSSFVGFLFPNRWLDWKENRVLANAEIESFRTLLANRVNAVQDLYYNIQIQQWGVAVYKHYITMTGQVIEELKEQTRLGTRTISPADFDVLENFKARFTYDLATLDTLSATIAQMAQAVGWSFDKNWTHLKFMTTHFHPLTTDKGWNDSPEALDQVFPSCLSRKPGEPPVGEELALICIKEALEKSTEMRNFKMLIEAGLAGKRSNYFDFFDPRSDNDLGYGYGQRIKIAKSRISVLGIQKDRAEGQIRADLFQAYNNYECGLERNEASNQGLKALEGLRSTCEEMVNNPNIEFDINTLVRFYEFSVEAGIRYIFSYFEVRGAQAVFNRYTWNGPLYELVRSYVDTKLSADYKKIQKKHRLRLFSKLFEKLKHHHSKEREETTD